MRLEINISDELPEAQILSRVSDLGSYLMELVRIDGGTSAKSLMDNEPNYAKIFADARNCPSAFKTREEVDHYIEQLRNDW